MHSLIHVYIVVAYLGVEKESWYSICFLTLPQPSVLRQGWSGSKQATNCAHDSRCAIMQNVCTRLSIRFGVDAPYLVC